MTQMKTWKRFGIFALLGVFLSWMVSCSSGPTSSNGNQATGGPQQIEFWTMQLQPDFTDYFNQLIATFEQNNPDIKVDWVDVPWADMERKILAAVSARTAPDVVNLNPTFASQLASGLWQEHTVEHIRYALETGQPFQEERHNPESGQWMLIRLTKYVDGVVLTGQDEHNAIAGGLE